MTPKPLRELAHPVRAWDTDVDTAESELEATGSQAFLVAVHAFAWRSSMALVPAAWIVVLLNAPADRMALALAVGTLVGLFSAQAIATFLTFPVAYFATLQTWFRGSRDARIRFGTTGFVYNYYGWRYAFRDRTRPWGALSREERVARNPTRAGVHEGPTPSAELLARVADLCCTGGGVPIHARDAPAVGELWSVPPPCREARALPTSLAMSRSSIPPRS